MKLEGKLVIEPGWCKGCGICVAFCPRNALAMVDEKAVLADAAACSLCGFCEQHCPDYAIYVDRTEKAADPDAELDMNTDSDPDAGTDASAGFGTGTNAGAGFGTGMDAGAGAGGVCHA